MQGSVWRIWPVRILVELDMSVERGDSFEWVKLNFLWGGSSSNRLMLQNFVCLHTIWIMQKNCSTRHNVGKIESDGKRLIKKMDSILNKQQDNRKFETIYTFFSTYACNIVLLSMFCRFMVFSANQFFSKLFCYRMCVFAQILINVSTEIFNV
jgi:hypothetical protein